MNTPEPPAEPLATPAEVAAYLGRSVQALAQLRFNGTGPTYVKTGRLIRYRWADVAAWVASGAALKNPAGLTR